MDSASGPIAGSMPIRAIGLNDLLALRCGEQADLILAMLGYRATDRRCHELKMDMKYRAPEDLLVLIDKLHALPPELKSQVAEILPETRD